jgi:integrase
MPDSINLLDKKLWLYQRKGSPVWQTRYCIKKGEWHRASTGEEDLEKAKQAANRIYFSAEERLSQGRPAVSRSFRIVAKAAVARMENESKSGEGIASFEDYIRVINKLLIPYFRSKNISEVTSADLKDWAKWRDEQLAQDRFNKAQSAALKNASTKKERTAAIAMEIDITPAAKSTAGTHNAAINRVFDEAQSNGWVTKSTRPKPPNKGKKSESRGAFTEDEYVFIQHNILNWANTGHRKVTREIRELLVHYTGFLAGTGVRAGTEAFNLKWKNIEEYNKRGERSYIVVHVDGKIGQRELIATDMATTHLIGLLKLNPNIVEKNLKKALKKQLDEYVFVDRSGNRVTTDALRGSFTAFLKKHNLRYGADGKSRALYSLRHTYATMALMEGRDVYQLSLQMGTSVTMIEEFYSKISARHHADAHSGRTKYKMPKDES